MKTLINFFVVIVISSTAVLSQSNHDWEIKNFSLDKSEANSKQFSKLEKSNLKPYKTVFGFLPWWVYLNKNGLNINYNLLTHLAIFSFEADGNGNLSVPPDSTWPWQDITENAIENDVKIIMTITNFNGDDIHSLFVDNGKRKKLFDNIKSEIALFGFNGLMIDFENVNAGDDRQYAFKNFMRLLKQEVQELEGFEISVALPAVAFGNWDFEGIAQYCDYVLLMGYDFYGKWSATTGPSAPLIGGNFNITKSVEQDYKNIPPEKLILGVPYYGNLWKTNTGEPYAAVAPFNDENQFNNWQASVFYKDIYETYSQYEKFFDSASNTPWARLKENDNSWMQLWYDDSTSLALKYDLVLQKNLKGVGLWALGYDGNRTELWELLENKFVKPTSVNEENNVSNGVVLYQNYPNPFNPITKISYALPERMNVKISVYDILAREVAVLENGYKEAGRYEIIFNGYNLSCGVYFYKLEAGNYTEIKKFILLK